MVERIARRERKTRETELAVTVRLDGSGEVKAETGIGFFDHMLDQLGRHGLMDIIVQGSGDRHIDDHHTVEDVGILLGQAFRQALGEKRSIRRFGSAAVPLDEALVVVDLDISGRGGYFLAGEFPKEKTGTFDSYLAEDFFRAFATNAEITMHMEIRRGMNPHHIVESAFKSTAVALRDAVVVDSRIVGVPSTKGVL
ncbi:MAG: imidazoleglycerol-phosphate dehydratase HisB [Candidatus Hydrogenedentota bacterium]|nr:MAG: imidazoleglycerol-phosphate dehydratase HisB [Candidatus Hydrogenedentota bacterium]